MSMILREVWYLVGLIVFSVELDMSEKKWQNSIYGLDLQPVFHFMNMTNCKTAVTGEIEI